MNKFTLITSILIFCYGQLWPGNIDIETARHVAKNFYFEQTGVNQKNVEFEQELKSKHNGEIYYYVFVDDVKGGYIIVSAHDVISPVIGYSFDSPINLENQPPSFRHWMQNYIDGINYKNEHNISTTSHIKSMWKKYTSAYESIMPLGYGKSVSPLTVDIKWGQSDGWDDSAPSDAVVGCVATAMGILMKYHEYPSQGHGEYSYKPSNYPLQSVNFSEQYYDFLDMSNSSATTGAAKLLYHAAVSVQMEFGPEESAAYTVDVRDALWYFFLYKPGRYQVRDGNKAWEDTLKAEIDKGRPIIYSGSGEEYGHAFICDGYDNDGRFHFNFGWEGYNNGYFDLDGANFRYPQRQRCFTGIVPEDVLITKRSPEEVKKHSPGLAKRLGLDENEVRVFPNPSPRGVFNIATDLEILSVDIFNLNGQKVRTEDNSGKINMTGQKPGMYIMQVRTPGKVISQQIIIK